MKNHKTTSAGMLMAMALLSGCEEKREPVEEETAETASLILYPARCTEAGICIAYRAATEDGDGDAVSDEDEEALGTDPAKTDVDAQLPALIELAAAGRLPSFQGGRSQMIVMPEMGPNGVALVPSRFVGIRKSSAERMGISSDVLSSYGLSLENGLVIDVPGTAPDAQDAPARRRVGGIDMGTISQEKGDGAPVIPNNEPGNTGGTMGGDSQGGKTFGENLWEGVKKMFGGGSTSGPDGGAPDAGTAGAPKTYTSGEEGDAVMPLTEADYERVLVRLGATRRPADRPPVPTDPEGIDFNPRRTIMLVDEGEADPRFEQMLKIILTVPAFDNPNERNTNFGPNGPIVGGVVPDSIWPKP